MPDYFLEVYAFLHYYIIYLVVFPYAQYSFVSHAISASVSTVHVRCCFRSNDTADSGEMNSWHAQCENAGGVKQRGSIKCGLGLANFKTVSNTTFF